LIRQLHLSYHLLRTLAGRDTIDKRPAVALVGLELRIVPLVPLLIGRDIIAELADPLGERFGLLNTEELVPLRTPDDVRLRRGLVLDDDSDGVTHLLQVSKREASEFVDDFADARSGRLTHECGRVVHLLVLALLKSDTSDSLVQIIVRHLAGFNECVNTLADTHPLSRNAESGREKAGDANANLIHRIEIDESEQGHHEHADRLCDVRRRPLESRDSESNAFAEEVWKDREYVPESLEHRRQTLNSLLYLPRSQTTLKFGSHSVT
jgi:hypothetical protein